MKGLVFVLNAYFNPFHTQWSSNFFRISKFKCCWKSKENYN